MTLFLHVLMANDVLWGLENECHLFDWFSGIQGIRSLSLTSWGFSWLPQPIIMFMSGVSDSLQWLQIILCVYTFFSASEISPPTSRSLQIEVGYSYTKCLKTCPS